MIRTAILSLPAVVLLAVNSCPQPQSGQAPPATAADAREKPAAQTREAPPPAPAPPRDLEAARRHAIHTDRLQVIMAGLGSQVTKTWPQEMEPPPDTGGSAEYEEARQLAAALARAADQIPEAIVGVPLKDEERRAFMSRVSELRSYASRLETSAARRNSRQMRSSLRDIQGTCYACHDRFREVAGPIQFGRAR